MHCKHLIDIVKKFYNNNNFSIRKISDIFDIPKSTIHRWINLDMGQNIKKEKNNNKINNFKDIIYEQLASNPLFTAKDLQNIIKKKTNIILSISSIYIYTRQLGFSFKIIPNRNYNTKKDILEKTKLFKRKICNIKNKNIICLDESFFYTNDFKNKGWIHPNNDVIMYTKSNPIKYSLIMAISSTKIISYKILKDKNFNKDEFIDYLSNNLLAKISNKYILMDNVSFHKSKSVIDLIHKNNNKILYIPPYSPQFNPIENVFSIIKSKYRNFLCSKNEQSIHNIIDSFDYDLSNFFNNSFKNTKKITNFFL